MASALQVTVFSSCLCVLFGVAFSAVSPLLQSQAKTTDAPAWAPATQPREFSYNIADGIKGANQVRHETWNNGTMTGMYAYPLGGNEWQVVNYVADDQGFRVTSSKKVSEAELNGGHKNEKDSAEVNVDRDGSSYSYKVKASDIGQKQKQEKQQQEKQQKQSQQSQQQPEEQVESRNLREAELKKETEEVHAQKISSSLGSGKNVSSYSAAHNVTSDAKNTTAKHAAVKVENATASS